MPQSVESEPAPSATAKTNSGWQTAIVMLAGPIKHWWNENWETPEHWHYNAWRELVSKVLVEAGYLVYHPHMAFKGAWDERAQAVNDVALCTADVVLNLTPPGVPSQGTDGEVLYARNHGTLVIPAPPPVEFESGVAELMKQLDALGLKQPAVMQAEVIESLPFANLKPWLQEAALKALLKAFPKNYLRVHYKDKDTLYVLDCTVARLEKAESCTLFYIGFDFIALEDIVKIEVLGQ